jgi:hypothetical protein
MSSSSKTRKNNDGYASAISRFFRRTTSKRQSRYLQAKCRDPDMCLLINYERQKISEFFQTFSKKFIQTPIKRIGAVSVNGFIHHIHYHRDSYDAYAVMKSAAKKDADNLMYEYLVGKELNKYRSRFPNLVETYGLYHYRSETAWASAKDMKSITTEPKKMEYLQGLIHINDEENTLNQLLTFSCTHSKHIAILIENIKNPTTFADLLDDIQEDDFLCILFQVYYLLHELRHIFTHYDLHANNVLIIDFGEDNYMEYVYHIKDEVIVMKCRYLAKIIDYGRSCIYKKSKEIHRELCKISECRFDKRNPDDCGDAYGHTWLSDAGDDEHAYYVRSTKLNNSHDLKLLTNLVLLYMNNYELYEEIQDLLSKVYYKDDYGTPPKTRGPNKSTKIYCVTDAIVELTIIIIGPEYGRYNERNYMDKTLVGTLNIYSDGRPFEFEMSQK